jgi:hypothetical protein
MLIEAAGPAILAAISPTALLLAVLIVVICASPAWRPGLAFLIVPEPTDTAFPGLQRMAARKGRMILACTIVAAGLIVATDGLVGLTKKG